MVVETDSFDTLNHQQIIDKTNAHAWSMETGDPVDVKIKKIHKSGMFDSSVATVEFSTEKDVRLTIDVYEQDRIYLPLSNVYTQQSSVMRDIFIVFSFFTIFLAIIPVIFFMIALYIIKKEGKIIERLLYKRSE